MKRYAALSNAGQHAACPVELPLRARCTIQAIGATLHVTFRVPSAGHTRNRRL